MINRIKEVVGAFVTGSKVEEEAAPRLVIVDPAALQEAIKEEEPRSHLLGLFAEVAEDQIAELIHALLVVVESEYATRQRKDAFLLIFIFPHMAVPRMICLHYMI